MENGIKSGSVLMQEGTLAPPWLQAATKKYNHDWRSVEDYTSYDLDKQLRQSGWGLSSIAGTVISGGAGMSRESAFRWAMRRVLARVKHLAFNSIEITQVSRKNFLGLHVVNV